MSRTRWVLASVASVAALAGMTVTAAWSGWEQLRSRPVLPVALDDDGRGTISNATVSLVGVEPLEHVQDGDEGWLPPEGWAFWEVELDVHAPEPTDPEQLSVPDATVLIDGSDGRSYSRSELLGTAGMPDEGWAGFYTLSSGRFEDVVMMPEGVTPERVRFVPSMFTDRYWSFPL